MSRRKGLTLADDVVAVTLIRAIASFVKRRSEAAIVSVKACRARCGMI